MNDSINLITNLKNLNNVSSFFEVPKGQLLYILYKQSDEKKYKKFEIPKKNGKHRNISAPIGSIRILQDKLKPILYKLYKNKTCVHGFVEKKSVVTNAKSHLKSKCILNIDLLDFFNTINFGRIRGLFMAKPFGMPADVATVFAQLCAFNDSLPQGSPISPILSNFIAFNLDQRLLKIARKNKLRYTRYADDITFSGRNEKLLNSIVSWSGYGNCKITNVVLDSHLESEIKNAGFTINPRKTRVLSKSVRQEVTGITINEFPNVKRAYVRKLRALLHNWESRGLVEAEEYHYKKHLGENDCLKEKIGNGERFKSVVYGTLGYLKMVRGGDDRIYRRFCLKIGNLDENPPKWITQMKKEYEHYDVFICHASEDKLTVAQPIFDALEKIGVVAFLDNEFIDWGDSLTKKINNALGKAKYVLAVLSDNFVGKKWPMREINSVIALEVDGEKKILPLLVGNPKISIKLPLLADILYSKWSDNPDEIAEKIKALLTKQPLNSGSNIDSK